MSQNKPPAGGDRRGGTEGGTAMPLPGNDMPSTPAAGSPAGGTTNPAAGTPRRAPADQSDPTDTLSRASGDGTRHGSANEAAREARSSVDAPTRSGFNAGDPANESREDTSDGTRASTSGKKLGEPGEVAASEDN